MKSKKPVDIDHYISAFPEPIQVRLHEIRTTIRKVVPEAMETISYGIPTFNANGTYLIYFAAYKKHIGMYPVPADLDIIDKAFAKYETSGRGTIQFPHDEPIPVKLIVKLVKYRLADTKQKRAK